MSRLASDTSSLLAIKQLPLPISKYLSLVLLGEGQNLERRIVERPIFRNFKITNIKIMKDELFDNFIFEYYFSFFKNHLYTQNI